MPSEAGQDPVLRTLMVQSESGGLCGSAGIWEEQSTGSYLRAVRLNKKSTESYLIPQPRVSTANMIQCIAPHLLWDVKPGQATETPQKITPC